MKSYEQQIIDEYGELTRRIDEFRPVVAQHKNLKQQIQSWCEDQPEESCEYEGRVYRVQIGPRSLERTIPSMRRIYRALGVTRFLEWCTFPLAALDKTMADQSGYVEESRTGPRTVKAVLMAKAAAVAVQKVAEQKLAA